MIMMLPYIILFGNYSVGMSSLLEIKDILRSKSDITKIFLPEELISELIDLSKMPKEYIHFGYDLITMLLYIRYIRLAKMCIPEIF